MAENIENKDSNNSVDSSILENKAVVDFSDIDTEIEKESKSKKEKIESTLKEKEEKKEESFKDPELNDKLAKAIFDEEEDKSKEEVKHKITKNNSYKKEPEVVKEKIEESNNEELILEEDEVKKRAKTSIIDDDDISDEATEEDEELFTTPDPRSNPHRVNISDSKSEIKEEFVIDTEHKEKIIDEKETNTETNQKKEELQKKIDERLVKRTGYKVYGGEGGTPCIVASDNPNIKALEEWNIPSDKIKPIANNDESLKKAFLDQYITLSNAQDSTVVDHRISRIPLLLSGYYAEMTDYSMAELSSVLRVIRNPEYKFARRFQEELVSLFNHISWTSLKPNGEKLTFDEWVSKTKFADLNMFYFGAYDATYPGMGSYDITCGNCNNRFSVSKTNRALSYMLQNNNDPILTDTFIRDVLMEKIPVSDLRKTLVYSKANTNYDEKVIRPHNYKISYGCPSILDVLEYLSVFDEYLKDDFEDFDAIIEADSDGHNLLSMYTMIKSVVLPVIRGKNANGQNVVSFYKIDTEIEDPEERMKNRRYIVKILKDLPQSEFGELFTGKEVAERKRLTGIVHILHNTVCPNCGVTIPRIVIDMRTNFFIRTATVVDRIDQL